MIHYIRMLCRVNHKMASKRPGDPLGDETPGKVSRHETFSENTTSKWSELNRQSKFNLIEGLYNVINKRNIELFVDIESNYFEECKEMSKEIMGAMDSTFNTKSVKIHVPEGDKGGVFFMDLGKGLRQNIIKKMNIFFKNKTKHDITVSAGLPSHMKTYEENYRSLAIEMIQGNKLEDDVDMNDPMRIYYKKFIEILDKVNKSTKLQKSKILPQDIIDYLCIPLINLSENCGERFSKERDEKNAFQKADGYFLVKALKNPPQLDEFDSSDQRTKTALQYTMKWLYNFVHEKEIQPIPWSRYKFKIGETENWVKVAKFMVFLDIVAKGSNPHTVVDTTLKGYSSPPTNAGNDASGDTPIFEGNGSLPVLDTTIAIFSGDDASPETPDSPIVNKMFDKMLGELFDDTNKPKDSGDTLKDTPVFNGKSVGRSGKDSGEDSGIYLKTFSEDDPGDDSGDDLRALTSSDLNKRMDMGILKSLKD